MRAVESFTIASEAPGLETLKIRGMSPVCDATKPSDWSIEHQDRTAGAMQNRVRHAAEHQARQTVPSP